ncbi:MAG: SAM-dependent methyltransferase, partial [Chloroflexota bacterium]|nr:SAM-dependent methyltransferase [Chloroflexota bacterium]
ADRIITVSGDMSNLDFEPHNFDLIWAESSAYIMGFGNALRGWKPLLKKNGYLAVTEASWIHAGPPEELLSFWTEEYPEIQDIDSNLAVIHETGYELIGQFVLPESDWWDNYYLPIQSRLPRIRDKYRGDPEALAVIESHEREIDMYSRYSFYYGYVFYVMQIPR